MVWRLLLILVSDTHQKDHHHTLLTPHISSFHPTLHNSLVIIFPELPIRKTLDAHHQILPETDPVVELYLAPLVGLVYEVYDNAALVSFKDKQIEVLEVASADCEGFETEAVLKVAFAVVSARGRKGVAFEVIGHGVVNHLRKDETGRARPKLRDVAARLA